MGSGAVLGLAPAPEYTFLIYVSPVGNYFKVCNFFMHTNYNLVCNLILVSLPCSLSLLQYLLSIIDCTLTHMHTLAQTCTYTNKKCLLCYHVERCCYNQSWCAYKL